MPSNKLKMPFNLDTLSANEVHYIPVIPDNNHWLIYLKNNGSEGKKLGNKIISELLVFKTENEHGDFDVNGQENESCAGIVFEKWHGLLQEERQILKSQIEEYFEMKNEWEKFVAEGSNQLEIELDLFENLIDNPYSKGYELGQKIEPFLERGKKIAEDLFKLNTSLSTYAIGAVIPKRLGISWTEEETELLHPQMRQAISDFISKERLGWQVSDVWEDDTNDENAGGNGMPNPTGLKSSMTSNNGATTPDSTT